MSILQIRQEDGTIRDVLCLRGKTGVGITKAEINESGELSIEYSNNTKTNLGNVVGQPGQPGESGVHIGASAPTDPSVRVWLDTTGDSMKFNPVQATEEMKTPVGVDTEGKLWVDVSVAINEALSNIGIAEEGAF